MRLFVSAVLAAVAVAGAAMPLSAQPISYQGRFTDNGQAPQGDYQIRFTVHTAPTGTNPIGTPLTRSLTIGDAEDGVFNFQDLDFGPGVFTGPGRWMQIEVARDGEPFTQLSPRQPLNATPYSIFAQKSGTTLQEAFVNGPTISTGATGPLQVAGAVQIGNSSTNGALQLFQNGAATPVIQMFNLSGQGGSIRLRDEAAFDIAKLEADPQGFGGIFRVEGNGGALFYDGALGSGASTGSLFSITGPASSLQLNTSLTGDDALVLPPRSVGPEELTSTVGLASIFRNQSVNLVTNLSNTTTITSRSITVPGPGYVVVIGTASIGFNRAQTTDGLVLMAVSDVSNTVPFPTRVAVQMPRSALTNGLYNFSAASHGVFDVPSAGQYTFYLNGTSSGYQGAPVAANANLTLLFVPTTYGDVTPNLLNDGPGGVGAPMSREQILAEQLAEQQRAMDELRAEQARLKAQMDEIRARSGGQ